MMTNGFYSFDYILLLTSKVDEGAIASWMSSTMKHLIKKG